MDLTKFKLQINNRAVSLFEEWEGTQIIASISEDETQANITTEEFDFVTTARREILNHVDEGYYFEGPSFVLQLKNGPQSYSAFRGLINLQDTLINKSSDRVSAKIEKLDDLTTFMQKLSGISYGYLDSVGLVESKDVQYVIEKKNNYLEIVMTGITIYLMVKELIEIQKKLSENIGDAVALATGGGTTGGLGAILLLAGKIIVNATFSVLITDALLELSEQMLENFISRVRKYKVCSYKELLRSACEFFGYGFSSTIEELDFYHFLPSKPYDEEIKSGVPRTSDPGYICSEFFEICKRMFAANIGIIDNVVYLENKDSNFWIKQSTWRMPDIFIEASRRNGDELVGTRLLSFETDVNDEWTINNIKGTYYEIRTFQSSYKNGFDYLTIDALDDRIFPFCLGNRKDRLNDLEESLKALAEVVDEVVSTLGGTSNNASLVQNRVGMLKLGTDQHSIPRILYLNGGKMPSNHRELLSAKALYEKFVKAESFVLSENGGQKLVFEGVKVPFGFHDFTELIENAYFVTPSGGVGKVTNIEWTIDGDFAVLDYWIKDPNPTDKLVEQYLEPS
jgi:hypothetical protein